MGVTLKYVGSLCMDDYYRDYKGNTGFYELDDFIARAGATVADYYQKAYDAKYAELRQEKRSKDELVGIDPDLLSVQKLTFKDNEATIQFPVMSFFSDKSSVGYQFILPVPANQVIMERSSMDDLWLYQYIPTSNRVFWRPQNGKIKIFKNSNCNVNEAELYYIPSVMGKDGEVFGDAIIPDGIVDYAINATVAKLRQVEAPVVKMSNDENENSTIQTEVNPKAVR